MKFLEKLFGIGAGRDTAMLQISCIELEGWLDKTLKGSSEEIYKPIIIIRNKINDLNENIKKLEVAVFPPDTEEKIKIIVRSNKDSYIRQARAFVGKVNHIINDDDKLSVSEKLLKELTLLNKNSLRNFYIVQNIFRREIGAVASDLSSINKSTMALSNSLRESIVQKSRNAYDMIDYFNSTISDKRHYQLEKERLVLENQNNDMIMKELLSRIHDMQRDKEYEELEKLNENKSRLDDEISSITNEAIVAFSSIRRVLRKFQHVNNSKLLEKYINNPKTILIDRDPEIFNLLRELRNLIITKKIDLRDKEAKYLKLIEELSDKKLKDLVDDYNKKIDQLKITAAKINSIDIANNISNIQKRINNIEQNINSNNVSIEKIDKKIINLNLCEKITNLENHLYDLTGERIKIVY